MNHDSNSKQQVTLTKMKGSFLGGIVKLLLIGVIAFGAFLYMDNPKLRNNLITFVETNIKSIFGGDSDLSHPIYCNCKVRSANEIKTRSMLCPAGTTGCNPGARFPSCCR